MAGKLSFQFVLEGASTAAKDLKYVQELAERMQKAISGQNLLGSLQSSISGSLGNIKNTFDTAGKQAGDAFRKGMAQANPNAHFEQTMRNRQYYQGLMASGPPPVIPPSIIGGGAGSFGGGGSGPVSNLIGALGKLGPALYALKQIVNQLAKAFEFLKDHIFAGAKLYTDAAKLGKDPGKLYGIRTALDMAGISESQADLLMLYGEFPNTRSSGRGGLHGNQVRGRTGASASVDGTTFGSGRGVRQIGELQEIANLYDKIIGYNKQLVIDSEIMGKNAKSLFEQGAALKAFKSEWNTAWTQFAEAIGVLALPLLRSFTNQLKNFNAVLTLAFNTPGSGLWLLRKIQGLDGKADFNQIGSGGNSRIPANQFQRMGFVFGAGNYQPHEYAKKTADSTTKTAAAVQALVKIVSGGGSFNPMGIMSGGMNFNMP